MSLPPAILAADIAALASSVLLPLLGLIALAVAGWFAVTKLRAWAKPSEDLDEGFTLEDLRRLHREGQISEEEFQRAHAQMVSSVRRAPSRKEAAATAPKPGGALGAASRPKARATTKEAADAQRWLESTLRTTPAAPDAPQPSPSPKPPSLRDASEPNGQRPEPRAAQRPEGQIRIRDARADDAPPPKAPPRRPTDPRTDGSG